MNDPAWREEVPKYVRVSQIIVGALVLGCVSFLGIVLAIGGPAVQQAGDAGPTLLLSYMALVFLVADIIARLIVPRLMIRAGRHSIACGTFAMPIFDQSSAAQARREAFEQMGDAGRLLMLFQTKTIIAGAILEGATFFLLIAYMIERYTPVLVIAVAMIVAIAAHIPTSRGVIDWIEDQLRLLREERSLVR
jgi:hypothetical protein